MARATKLAILLIASIFPFTGLAQLLFTTNDGVITITGYTGTNLNVIIPAVTNGYPVTIIGQSAFEESHATNVSLPDTITNIGNSAFYDAQWIVSMRIPDSVLKIGSSAFVDGFKLTNVIIGSNVTSIGTYAFDYCISLKDIFIPAGVTNFLSGSIFNDCTSLTNISVDVNNPAYSSKSGVLFDKSQNTLVRYPSGLMTNYVIPTNVTSIGDYAFEPSSSLTNVVIPFGVTNVGQEAFVRCYNVAKFSVPATLTTIGPRAFSQCGTFTSINIPNGVINIEQGAFSYTALTNAFIPATVTNLAQDAFRAYYLKSITVDASNPVYSSLNGVLCDVDQTTLLFCPMAISGSYGHGGSYTVPQGISSLGDSAFTGCFLTNITIANTVTNIGSDAFEGCDSLTNIVIPHSVTCIGADAFEVTGITNLFIPSSVTSFGSLGFCDKLVAIYFEGNAPNLVTNDYSSAYAPDATAYYLAGTIGWGTYFQDPAIPTALWSPKLMPNSPDFGVHSNSFGFRINWGPVATVIVEACSDLSVANWQPIRTNSLTTGSAIFSDAQPLNSPSRFYRVRTQ